MSQRERVVAPADDRPAAPGPAAGSPATVRGAGSLDRLGEVCSSLGARRIMAVAGGSADDTAARLPYLLGGRYVGRWSNVPAHVPAYQASLAVGSAQETHADAVLAIGGGSATGLAKIVALALRLPLVAVPTTYSGSEMTSRYLVTTERGLETGTSGRVLARTVIYDPDLVAALPPQIAASSGITAVAHCIEALCYPAAPPEARDRAREGLPLLWDSLSKIAAGATGLDCRQDALAGASLAGQAHEATGPGLLHLLCEVAAARHPAGSGMLHAVLLPHVLRAHGDQAQQARSAIAELRPGVPAETALAELSCALRITADLDRAGLRSAITALTAEVSAHPAARPDRIQQPAIQRLQELASTS
jgi:maleylacetate reductase